MSAAASTDVRTSSDGDVAVVVIDHAPVNALGDTLRRDLAAALRDATWTPGVRAVVLAGAGRLFCGGADVRQFATPAARRGPLLRDLIDILEGSPRPVIAAIHGAALGGGLELALGCHHRIVAVDAELGLPEVTLGMVPGGGATQRLPRLVGTARTLELAQSARRLRGAEAVEWGLADEVFTGDPVTAGVRYARELPVEDPGDRVIGSRKVRDDVDLVDLEARRAAVDPRARNAEAQRAVISCVEAAGRLPLDEGLDHERAVFDEHVARPTTRALRHLVFAERRAATVEGWVTRPAARPIHTVAVVGAGTMGRGIAMAFANAGLPVTLLDTAAESLDRGLEAIASNYAATAAKGRLSAEQVRERRQLIRPASDLVALADADLVVEAVFEDMDLKKELFARIEAVCGPRTVLATNTSRLDVDEIAAATGRRGDVIGLHFFSPAHVMPLLEVVRAEKTSDEVVATGLAVASLLGKIPVLVRVGEGFVGNRMLTPYWREAWFLLEEGATPTQVDRAMTDFGMAMGPLATADLAGLDINWAARKRLAPTRPAHLRYSSVPDRICELGRFGQKTGAGFFRYDPGDRTPRPDPVVDEVIEQCARDAGIARRSVDDAEIVERCVLALVNEGARLLGEGIAQRASDIDVVYCDGYGFPTSRGGPMFHAETLGLDHLVTRLRALCAEHGEHWEPAPLLVRAVESGAVAL